jgi:alpha-beta hydrolase superfamily lysophospholipase
MKIISDNFSYMGKNIAYEIYEPECEVRAVVQISHGMCEYVGRYAEYAKHLCSIGIVLAGNDHPGHGRSAQDESELGYFAKDGGVELAVGALCEMSGILSERYPEKPIILLGHSMGSFLCRLYLTKYAENLAGAIIMGTAGPGAPTGAGIMLADLIALFRGDKHRSKLLRSIQQSGYLKKCGKGADRTDWLSRDRTIVEKYNNDKYCNYIFTVSGYRDLFRMLGEVTSLEWAPSVPIDLPILIISGEDDPVGGYGKGVCKVAGALTHAGAKRLTTVLIPGARHEVLNETDREETYALIDKWLNEEIIMDGVAVENKETDAVKSEIEEFGYETRSVIEL